MDATRPRGSALPPPFARIALLGLAAYVLVISTVPFVRLLRSTEPAARALSVVLDRDRLVFDFVMWSVIPAIVLLLAGWRLGRSPGGVDRLLRVTASVMSGYVLLGSLAILADASTSAAGVAIAIAVAGAAAGALIGLARWSPARPRWTPPSGPPGRPSTTRSATTIR